MKRILFLITIFSFFITYSYAQPNKSEEYVKMFKARYNTIEVFIENENYLAALPILRDLSNKDPENCNISFLIGVCYSNTFNKTKAIEYLEKATKYTALDYDGGYDNRTAPILSHYYLGKAYHGSFQLDKAVKSYKKFKSYLLKGENDDLIKEVERLIDMCSNAKKLMANPSFVRIDNLGEKINSIYPDYYPLALSDGNSMIFTSRRNTSTGGLVEKNWKYMEDIYSSSFNKGIQSWDDVKSISPNVNTSGHEAAIAISKLGDDLLIVKDGDIFESKLINGQWSIPQNLGPEINNSKSNETSACFNPDGSAIYFVSDRKVGSLGGKDIYVTKKLGDGSWSKIENIGAPINSPYDEESPFITQDGTLYFSSKGQNSMGGYDVFYASPKGTTWNTPVNMGYPFNSPDDELFYMPTADKNFGYFASARYGGYGNLDLYSVTFLGKKAPDGLTWWKENQYICLNSPSPDQEKQRPIEVEAIAQKDTAKNENLAVNTNTESERLNPNSNGANNSENLNNTTNATKSENASNTNAVNTENNSNTNLNPSNTEVKSAAEIEKEKALLKENEIALAKQKEIDKKKEIEKAKAEAEKEKLKEKERIKAEALAEKERKKREKKESAPGTFKVDTNMSIIYTVQIGAGNLDISNFQKKVTDVRVLSGFKDGIKRFVVGTYASKEQAILTKQKMIDLGYSDCFVRSVVSSEISTGEAFVLKNIFFDFDQVTLSKDSKDALQKLIDYLKQNANQKVEIIGHTDNVGRKKYNQALSESRAKAVVDYLVANGVDNGRLIYRGYGSLRPIASNDTEAGRSKNRRTEFKVVSNFSVQ